MDHIGECLDCKDYPVQLDNGLCKYCKLKIEDTVNLRLDQKRKYDQSHWNNRISYN